MTRLKALREWLRDPARPFPSSSPRPAELDRDPPAPQPKASTVAHDLPEVVVVKLRAAAAATFQALSEDIPPAAAELAARVDALIARGAPEQLVMLPLLLDACRLAGHWQPLTRGLDRLEKGRRPPNP